MHDKNGNPVGISSHKFKTNISHSNDGEMVLSLNKENGLESISMPFYHSTANYL